MLLEHSRAIELLPRSVLGTIVLLVLMERNSKTVTTARASVSFMKLSTPKLFNDFCCYFEISTKFAAFW